MSGRPGTDQVESFGARLSVIGAINAFSINCDHLDTQIVDELFNPKFKAFFKLFWLNALEDSSYLSSLGIPLGKARNVESQACLLTP